MSPVWRVAVAAVRRRRFQSVVLGVVVLCSTVAIVVALGLLEAASAPFDRVFAEQRGAHVVAVYDRATVSDDRLLRAAGNPAVEAVAGPFAQTVVTVADTGHGLPPGPLTVVGRPGPGGPVDRVNLWAGHWATGPGQVVVNRPAAEEFFLDLLGTTVTLEGGQRLTVVGLASSVSRTSEAWVTPAQILAMRPAATQMLYRFTAPGTEAGMRAAVAAVAPGAPPLDWQSYLTVKHDVARPAEAYLPFLMGFGILGLAVAVLIVANVIGGAVVTGLRHIGVLKALGFTPAQVVAVYLAMVMVPAFAGCLLGTALGGLAARPLLSLLFQGLGAADFGAGVSARVYAAVLAGVPAVVVSAALVPASRAYRLPAAVAISAAPGPGRGRRVQRLLAGTRLPRSLSLGLALPFARPGRSALTLAAVVLGVTTVTLASGLFRTMTAYGDAAQRTGHVHTVVHVGRPDQTRPRLGDAGIEALLRSLPGATHVTADAWIDLHLAGRPERIMAQFLRGDFATRGDIIVRGRPQSGPGEVVAPSAFLRKHGLGVGDRLTLTLDDARAYATVVGETMDGANNLIMVSWPTLAALAPREKPNQYEVRLAPGTDVEVYNAAVRAADPGLYPATHSQVNTDTVAIAGAASIFTLLLAAVATLGVFNTVLLNTRERRRDLGMLKSIGMTPRQVTAMMVTSMAALGAAGALLGIPAGVAAHRVVVPAMFDAAEIAMPAFMLDVWGAGGLAALVPAGVGIAMLGAYLPARAAARMTIAEALRTE